MNRSSSSNNLGSRRGGGSSGGRNTSIIDFTPQDFGRSASPLIPPALHPVSTPEPPPTARNVVKVLSNADGVLTFEGGFQAVANEAYTVGDRILLINGLPSGRMSEDIEDVYI